MSHSILQILAVNVQQGVSKKSGLPFVLPKAQCVIKSEDGSIKVGELILSKDLASTPAGNFDATFTLDVDFNGKVVPRITALNPIQVKAAAIPAQNKAA